MRRAFWVSLAAFVLVIVLLPVRAGADRTGFDPASIYKVPLGDAPVSGPADAPVTIVAWSDYACQYCNYAAVHARPPRAALPPPASCAGCTARCRSTTTHTLTAEGRDIAAPGRRAGSGR